MTGVGYNQMERLIMLGTGNALVTRCYNTCFAIQDDDDRVLTNICLLMQAAATASCASFRMQIFPWRRSITFF